MLKPVLLSGGIGSRLWPVSREAYPKQFLPLCGELTMLQDTLARTQELDTQAALVVCNEDHRFMVAEQLRQAGNDGAKIILEPQGRNTAPAVALAALHMRAAGEAEGVMLVLPADHAITGPDAFVDVVKQALPSALAGRLVTFGVVPKHPETGYGYIRQGDAISGAVHEIAEFVEKPDLETAQRYLDSGDYLWNSGMFLLRADRYLEELAQFEPEMYSACEQAMQEVHGDKDFLRPDEQHFAQCSSNSIDYAVMERTQHGAVIALDCGWSDVGAWNSVWESAEHDEHGNATSGDVMLEQTSNSYVASHSRLLATVGVDNLVVVETADAVLVADRDKTQDVKHIVNRLKKEERSEASLHARVYRPWGSYESLVVAGRFQVKRIIVTPGQTLSLQLHHHRAEHWIVVKGTAEVTCEDRVFMLAEDESTYIPLGHKHRLSNPGRIPLEIIEVQTGSYLGEDDIVRFSDMYGRSEQEG
ncbi:MAG: mannose-1-phosphate guanylyltransferase/mannose-6-phosphate isomerase [Gammaproteobacteria bacterium]|nr:MAG: mannose-1-phosphate guanylyltransferase/mannose-6-phosphate isomerase [Gammaproteobacteria bacterium]